MRSVPSRPRKGFKASLTLLGSRASGAVGGAAFLPHPAHRHKQMRATAVEHKVVFIASIPQDPHAQTVVTFPAFHKYGMPELVVNLKQVKKGVRNLFLAGLTSFG
jgi:hypothetical protein